VANNVLDDMIGLKPTRGVLDELVDEPTPTDYSVAGFEDNPDLKGTLKSTGEAALTIGTGLAGMGLGGLSMFSFDTRSPQERAKTFEDIQEELTYQPRSQVGKELVQATMLPVTALDWAGEKGGEYLDEKGFPILAGISRFVGKATPFILPAAVKAGKSIKTATEFKGLRDVLEPIKEVSVPKGTTPVPPEGFVLDELAGVTPKVSPSLDNLATEQNLAMQRGSVTKPEKPSTQFSFENPETETRFTQANGLPQETIVDRVKSGINTLWTNLSRSYEHLPNTGEFAQLQFDLKSLEKQKNVAKDTTIKAIGDVTAGLDKTTYDIFRRKVILDDLSHEANLGRELPYGFTPETLIAEKKKFDTLADASPSVTDALAKRQATWDKLKQDYTEAMDSIGVDVSEKFTNESYFRHQVLEYANLQGIFGTGQKLKTPTNRGFLKQRKGSELDINSDYLQAEYQVMGQMKHDIETARIIKNIDKNYNIKSKVVKDAKAQGIEDWHEAIPKGYTTWQPREGNVFYMADTIPSKLANKINEGIVTEIAGEDLGKSLAMGGKRNEWVVKDEVANTLDEIVKTQNQGKYLEFDKKLLSGWKQWQLIQPRRWFKYNTRNLTGDAEAVFVGNPSAFTKTPQAVKELYEVFKNKKSMTPEMQEWFNRGGMSSTLQAQEMGDMKSLWMFSKLYEKTGKATDLPGKAWAKYWNTARLTTDAREATLRYSAYLDYLEQMQKNKGVPKNFGASKPEEIMGLKDIRDRAYWLSNDLLGAYDRVSVAGQSIRQHLIPFWSWQEVNMGRYKQLFKNAANDGNLATTIGRKLGATAPLVALRTGRLVLQASAFAAALQVYNHTVFPELEKTIPDEVRRKPHIILGQDEKGETLYFSRVGMLGDALSWFGVDGIQKEVREYLNGHKPLKQAAIDSTKEIAKGPINVLWSGAIPFAKLVIEGATRQSTFPDLWKSSTIRDRGLYLARSFGLENEYKFLTGKPSKGYGESISKAFIYSADPLETSYRDTYDLKSRFMKRIGKDSEGFWLTPKGDALYNMKLGMRYKDPDAISKYIIEYAKLGGTTKGIETSIKNMHPLSGMNENMKKAFMSQLTKEETNKVANAIKFYETTLMGNK